jgi:mRNA-degrading endonuclease RelE of RelBE toxin-antitoxin system
MSWAFEYTPNAEEDLSGLPKAIQKRVARVVGQMTEDPFRGNVKSLQGEEWDGVFRRRIGKYRLLFTVDHAKKLIVVQQISLRSGKTYR